MIEITKIFEFAAAHHLPYHKGACKNLHGHNYKLEVTIAGPIQKEGAERGMVMDFGHLKKIAKIQILNEFDHSNLNKLFDNPTAEIMVKNMALQLGIALPKDIEITKICLWETSTSYATWRKD